MAVGAPIILGSSAATYPKAVPTKPTAFPRADSFEIFRDYLLMKTDSTLANVQPVVALHLAAPMTQSLELLDCQRSQSGDALVGFQLFQAAAM